MKFCKPSKRLVTEKDRASNEKFFVNVKCKALKVVYKRDGQRYPNSGPNERRDGTDQTQKLLPMAKRGISLSFLQCCSDTMRLATQRPSKILK